MDRRTFITLPGALLAALSMPGCSTAAPRATAGGPALADTLAERCRALETGVGGRLGVALIDGRDGRSAAVRGDERFPMCSTFKWLAAAHVLARVDAGQERLDRRIRIPREALVAHSPVAERHVGGEMTLAQLCEATITESDNAAGNLVLQSFGGPAAFTAFARRIGDPATQLDRVEPALNEARADDVRDTTTPRAMARTLQALLLGEVLAPASRRQLVNWMRATRTSGERLRAALPPGWQLADKTGAGENGTNNDVGVFWTAQGRPVVLAVYLTGSPAPWDRRNGVIATLARAVTQG